MTEEKKYLGREIHYVECRAVYALKKDYESDDEWYSAIHEKQKKCAEYREGSCGRCAFSDWSGHDLLCHSHSAGIILGRPEKENA
jgi:hypothetical protein